MYYTQSIIMYYNVYNLYFNISYESMYINHICIVGTTIGTLIYDIYLYIYSKTSL